MKLNLSHICLTAFLWLTTLSASAQQGKDALAPKGALTPKDSVAIKDTLSAQDSLKLADLNAIVRESKPKRNWSTWKPDTKRALWLALVLPGAGQIYNRKYWKLPIIYGGFVGCAYAVTWNNQMYHDYSQAYVDIVDDDPTTDSYNKFLHLGATITDSNKARYTEIFRQRKDRYRRWRDMGMFVMIGIYALSVIDAYVDASLSEFDISDDLTLRIEPAVLNNQRSSNPFSNGSLGLQCSLTF